jgi:flavin reductase (DIM6/NTAB) family NADH-FMN oxidoreductase RutF
VGQSEANNSFNNFPLAKTIPKLSDRELAEEDVATSLKEVMRIYPQGVTVVAWRDRDGLKGLTVSAFTSVSVDPPLVLISISKGSAIHDAFVRAKRFAVNFLSCSQESIADRFAGKLGVKERFDGVEFTEGVTGSPVINGVRAVIECTTWKVYDGGDHSIQVGEVVRARKLSDIAPLVYYDQQYTTTEQSERSGAPFDAFW